MNSTHTWCWHNATSVAVLKLLLEVPKIPINIDTQTMVNGSYIKQFLFLLTTGHKVVNPDDLLISLLRDHLPGDFSIYDNYQPVNNSLHNIFISAQRDF